LRLTAIFLLLTLLAVYFIDTETVNSLGFASQKYPHTMYVRQETRNGPLFYPADPLR